jgi:hypothetical protein
VGPVSAGGKRVGPVIERSLIRNPEIKVEENDSKPFDKCNFFGAISNQGCSQLKAHTMKSAAKGGIYSQSVNDFFSREIFFYCELFVAAVVQLKSQ